MNRIERLRTRKSNWEKWRNRLFPVLTLLLGSILGAITGIDDPLKSGTVIGFIISGALLGLTLCLYLICWQRIASLTNSIKRA